MSSSVNKPPVLLAMLPCPLKVPLEEDFGRLRDAGGWGDLDDSELIFEGNANQSEFYKQVDQYERMEQLPELIITPGISSFFHRVFRSRFMDQGHFTDVTSSRELSRFRGMGLPDPTGRCTMLCVNPLVMVADHSRLEHLPVPGAWSDLLKPEYRGKVAMRGQKGTFCETTLLTLMKEYGMEAARLFGEAVAQGLHPAQMAKTAGTGHPEASPILVMPYFYARSIVKKDKVSVIWPKEGAIASPVFLLSRTDSLERNRSLLEYFTGMEAGRIYEHAGFPALHPDVESRLPEQARLLWMGWDLIWGGDIEQTTKNVHDCFMEGYRKGRQP